MPASPLVSRATQASQLQANLRCIHGGRTGVSVKSKDHRMRLPLVVLLSSLALLLAGCGTPSLLVTPVSNTNQLDETELISGQGWFAGKIAIIEVEGMLLNAKSGGVPQPPPEGMSLFPQEQNPAAT